MRLIRILLILPLLALSGCVTNNGDIGHLYGSWQLESVDIDGEEVTDWSDDGSNFVTWYFQNNIIGIEQTYINHVPVSTTTHGTWTMGDGTITFDFMHSDDSNVPGTGAYQAPEKIHFPAGVTTFDIVEYNSSRLTITTMLADDSRLTYSLRKIKL